MVNIRESKLILWPKCYSYDIFNRCLHTLKMIFEQNKFQRPALKQRLRNREVEKMEHFA